MLFPRAPDKRFTRGPSQRVSRLALARPGAMPARSLEAAAAERRRVRRLATLAAKQLPPPRRDAASAEEREPARRSPTPPSSCVPLLGCTTALRGSSISSRRTATRLAPVAAGREHAVAAVVPRAGARLSYSRAAPRRSADTTGHAAQRERASRPASARTCRAVLVARIYCASVDLVRARVFITQPQLSRVHSQRDS